MIQKFFCSNQAFSALLSQLSKINSVGLKYFLSTLTITSFVFEFTHHLNLSNHLILIPTSENAAQQISNGI